MDTLRKLIAFLAPSLHGLTLTMPRQTRAALAIAGTAAVALFNTYHPGSISDDTVNKICDALYGLLAGVFGFNVIAHESIDSIPDPPKPGPILDPQPLERRK